MKNTVTMKPNHPFNKKDASDSASFFIYAGSKVHFFELVSLRVAHPGTNYGHGFLMIELANSYGYLSVS